MQSTDLGTAVQSSFHHNPSENVTVQLYLHQQRQICSVSLSKLLSPNNVMQRLSRCSSTRLIIRGLLSISKLSSTLSRVSSTLRASIGTKSSVSTCSRCRLSALSAAGVVDTSGAGPECSSYTERLPVASSRPSSADSKQCLKFGSGFTGSAT